ncbi:MAG: hypothetical protein QM692_21290 [Thermomicrobiales bacterium]
MRGQLFSLVSLAVTAILVIAAAAPVLGLIYSLRPEWRPEGPPPVRAATLSNAVVEERGLTCPDTERQTCIRIGYDVEFEGFQRDQVMVAWAAFDPETLARVDLDVTGAPPPGQDKLYSYVVAQAASDRASHFVDVPVPRKGRCIFVRLSLVDFEAESTGLSLEPDPAATPAPDLAGQLVAAVPPRVTPTPAPWPTRLDVVDTPPFHTHDPQKSCDGSD